MDVVIIGSGNIAHCFSHFLQLHGHHIKQVLSRNEEHARQLAEQLNTDFSTHLDEIDLNADAYLLAVNDAAIPVLNEQLRLGKRLVAHTAGSVSLTAISDISSQTGVIYPLQTISKDNYTGKEIPLLIEANNENTMKRLNALASAISDEVIPMDSESRLKMHLGAVLCNNFPNYLATLCEDYCHSESLDYNLLQPLQKETFEQIRRKTTKSQQTGPARRGDKETIQKHQALLEKYPELRKLYDLFSESIQKYYLET